MNVGILPAYYGIPFLQKGWFTTYFMKKNIIVCVFFLMVGLKSLWSWDLAHEVIFKLNRHLAANFRACVV